MIASQRATPTVGSDGGDTAIRHSCHHPVGPGHLARSLAVAGALAGRNRVVVCLGRVPAGLAIPAGVEIVAVPPPGTGPDVNTPKLVGGAGETSLKEPAGSCAIFVEQVMPVSRPCVAERAKLGGNTFGRVTTARVNELVTSTGKLAAGIDQSIGAATGRPLHPPPRRTRCTRCSPNCS